MPLMPEGLSQRSDRPFGVARPLALALTVVGLMLCFWLRRLADPNAPAAVFLLIMMVCVALVLLVRGLGSRLGLGIGAAVGLAASVGLSLHFPAPASNLLAFVLIATSIAGFLGHLAGGWESFRLEPHEPGDVPSAAKDQAGGLGVRPTRGSAATCGSHAETRSAERGPAAQATPLVAGEPAENRVANGVSGAQRRTWLSPAGHRLTGPEELLGAIVADFCDWVESEAGRRCCTEPGDWSAFDQFLRSTLRERLGASGVRAYEVSSDGERLEPLARREVKADGWTPSTIGEWPSARVGLVGHVVTTGRIYVAGAPGEGAFIRELAESGAARAEGQSSGDSLPVQEGWRRWVWLLPLRAAKRTTALVAVGRLDGPAGCGPVLAEAVRNLLQLFWRHVRAQRALRRLMRTDRQSGMLNRVELLGRIDEIVRASAREGEPVMVLALAVEGLRRLDDTGQWSHRDMLVQRLGRVLLQKVRSDDVLGRFSDDRFVVVLRRLDSALGTLVAEKLMETVRAAVLDQGGTLAGTAGELTGLRLRAGLAGTGLPMVPHLVRPFTALDDLTTPAPADAGSAPTDGKSLLERALGLLDYAREQRIDIATDLMKGLPERLTRGGWQSPDPLSAHPSSRPSETEPAHGQRQAADVGHGGPTLQGSSGRPPSRPANQAPTEAHAPPDAEPPGRATDDEGGVA